MHLALALEALARHVWCVAPCCNPWTIDIDFYTDTDGALFAVVGDAT